MLIKKNIKKYSSTITEEGHGTAWWIFLFKKKIVNCWHLLYQYIIRRDLLELEVPESSHTECLNKTS